MADENLYELLQVQETADSEIIQAAYRRLILRYHPDQNAAPGALEMTQRLNHAYEILSDPKKREDYDKELKARASSNGAGAHQAAGGGPHIRTNQTPQSPRTSPARSRSGDNTSDLFEFRVPRWLLFAGVGITIIVVFGFLIAIGSGDSDGDTGRSTIAAPTTTVPSSTAITAPPPSPEPRVTQTPVARPVVRVDRTDFPVELAVTPDERSRGLSGRASLIAGTGMLFIFEGESRLRFWMKEMEISLDMVWIGANCRVVDISENVPPPEPGTSLDDLPRYSPRSPARYVLEINGGESAALDLVIGDQVQFLGGLEGLHGC